MKMTPMGSIHQTNAKSGLNEKMQFKKGKILVYNNQIAYRFDFSSFAIFSLLVDEKGKFLGFTDPTGYRLSNAIETESYREIIDPEIIKKRKVELLDSLSVTISNRTINELFKENYKIETVGKMIYKQGDIVVFYDHVTYQFDYEAEVIFSILIDQKGNFINPQKKIMFQLYKRIYRKD